MDLDSAPRTSRRKLLIAATGLAGGLAGCGSLSGDDAAPNGTGADGTGTPTAASATNAAGTAADDGAGTQTDDGVGTQTDDGAGPPTEDEAGTPVGTAAPTLRLGLAGAPADVLRAATETWNANERPQRRSVRGAEVRIDVEGRVADHFAAAHGLERTGTANRPPFTVTTTDVADSRELRDALNDDRLDLGTTDRPVRNSPQFVEQFGSTAVGYGGAGCFVSPAIADAGVTAVTNQQIRDVFTGEITNWATLGGPDREIMVVAGRVQTPWRPFRDHFLRTAEPDGIDARADPSDRYLLIRARDNAIGELPIAAATRSLPMLSVTDGESTYGPRSDEYGPTYPLRVLTLEDRDPRERAFLDYLRSSVVQYRLALDDEFLTRAPLATVES